jgi:hypothetical protein
MQHPDPGARKMNRLYLNKLDLTLVQVRQSHVTNLMRIKFDLSLRLLCLLDILIVGCSW